MVWTDDEDKQLIEMWREGLVGPKIAEAMGKSRGAIMGRISRLRGRGIELTARPRPPRKKRVWTTRPAKPKPMPKVLELAPVVRPIANAPVSPFVDTVEVPYEQPCDILSLRFFSCRYIVQEKPTLYCNSMVHKHSYCEKHFELCYQKGTNVPLAAKPRPAYRNAQR